MSFLKKLFGSLLILILAMIVYDSTPSHAATSPYDVESTVISGWNSTLGAKDYDMQTGRTLVYDVYSNKYTSGGYSIVNKDFGKGSQPYLNFQGWAIIFGHYQHTATNQETYIVAQKTDNSSTKVYGTLPINISATEDLEYNNQGSGLYNECSSTATNKSNLPWENNGCNMRYDSVGFNAYIPLNELFPDSATGGTWRLFIVKRVNSHIVYSKLILPFTFDDKPFYGGKVSLDSGINADKLVMVGDPVIRRTSAHCTTCSGSALGYFTQYNTYTRSSADESWTAIWYGVFDSGSIRWASTAYWAFGGSQAVINYDSPPQHISHEITGYRYRNGNDYWVQPNDSVFIRLRQRDVDTGNKYGYLRLYGSGVDVRSFHNYSASTTDNGQFATDANVVIGSALREENTSYGTIRWGVTPKTHGHNYDVMYYYTDLADNHIGYNSTGMNLRVDGVDPSVSYRNSTDTANFTTRAWDDTQIDVRLKLGDSDSGYKQSRYAWSTSTSTPSSWSGWTTNSNYLVSKNSFGQWYLHVQAEDNVGNIITTYSGPYRYNIAPVADFTWSPATIYNDTIVTFTNASTDADGNTLTYQWAYQAPGANSWVNFSTVEDPTRVFNIKGDWDIRLTVSDGTTTNSIIKTFTVKNRAPVANFIWSPTTIYNDTTVTFTNTSTDADGDTLTYQWDYQQPNSTTWTSFSTTKNPTKIFNIKGDWDIRLTVSDGTTTNSVIKTITVQNRPPVANFTWSPATIYNNTSVTFTNASTDADGDTLTYQWFYQQPSGSTWTSFSTSTSPSKILNIKGTWGIKLIVTDISGATATIVKNPVVINRKPIAGFTFDRSNYYEGDTINVTSTAVDPDGDTLTYLYQLTKPDVSQQNFTTSNFSFKADLPGVYTITQIVTDTSNATSNFTDSTNVQELIINGMVSHTIQWESIHNELNHLPEMFYSGEKFLLSATVTDAPIEYVNVNFKGLQIDNEELNLFKPLDSFHPIYTGDMYDMKMSNPPTKLANGNVYFLFSATWKNGVTKSDLVTVEIIDDVYKAYDFHRTN